MFSQAPISSSISPRSAPFTPKQRMALLAGVLAIGVVAIPLLYRRVFMAGEVANRLARGRVFLEEGRAANAEQEWHVVLELAPSNIAALQALGNLYFTQHRPLESRKMFLRIVDIAPREPHILCSLAEAELAAGNAELWEVAAEDASRAAALEPNCFRAQTVAAEAFRRLGEPKRAIDYWQAALRINPADAPLRVRLMCALLERSDLQGALALALELKQRAPGMAQAYALLGTLCQYFPPNSPENLEAESHLRHALELDPLNGYAHASLGRLYVRERRWQEAVRHLEASRLLHPSQSALLYDLACAYQGAGMMAKAERALSQFQQRSELENERIGVEKGLLNDPANRTLARRHKEIMAALGSRREKASEMEIPAPERMREKAIPQGAAQ